MKVLSIVNASVACYKYYDFARLFVKNHHKISTILTSASAEFISTTLLEALGSECYVKDTGKMEHISLTRGVDAIIIFAATADFIGRVANGIGGSLALDSITARPKHVKTYICPAMNVEMWNNTIVQSNITKLVEAGFIFINPDFGMLACGESGQGRLADINFIYAQVVNINKPLLGKKVVITVGSTIEKIDDVRFITNFSSGIQGVAIADKMANLGADVTLVCGKVSCDLSGNYKVINAESASAMLNEVLGQMPCDAFVGVAAVCDFYVKNKVSGKIKKDLNDVYTIELAKNPDILKQVSYFEKRPKCVIGFAAEVENVMQNAKNKLSSKKLDLIIANDVSKGDGFGAKQSKNVYFITNNGIDKSFDVVTKDKIAENICDFVTKFLQT